jgi:hypothetical protein
MTLAADPRARDVCLHPEVGSRGEETLNLLASWTASEDETVAADTVDLSE